MTRMVNASNFFDVQQVISELIGDWVLFLILGVFLIVLVTRKANTTHHVGIVLVILFFAAVSTQVNVLFVWILAVLSAALIFYLAVSKTVDR